MTDEQIIKALECCGEDSDCKHCPYYVNERYTCGKYFNKNVLDLINRKNEELERLTHNLEAMAQTMPNMAKAERAEAVKEFAEELIYKIVNTPTKFESTYYMYRKGIAFRQNEIIDIIKEMAGDGT